MFKPEQQYNKEDLILREIMWTEGGQLELQWDKKDWRIWQECTNNTC